MKNLKALLSLLILLAVALPVVLSTAISSYLIEGNSKQQIRQRFVSEVGHIERHVTTIFDQVEARVQFLANSAAVKQSVGQLPRYQDKTDVTTESITFNSPLQRQAYQLFERIGGTMADISYVYIGDTPGGYLQWPIGPLTDNYDPTNRPWFLSGLSGEGEIVRPPAYYWAADDTVVISTVKAIQQGEDTGVLGVDVSLAQLDSTLKNLDLGFGERFLLIEKSGTVLADTKNSQYLFSNFAELAANPAIKQMNALRHTQAAEIEINGELNWVSKFDFSQLGWTFYILVPNQALVQQSRQINVYTIPIALVCILLFCLIGYAIAAKITNLIRNRERQLLEAKSQAEQAVIAKSQFLATMSHEIRTPLNGVLGMTQLLAKTPMSQEQKKKLDTILLSGNRLMHLINEVLDLSKVEAEELVLSPHRVKLAQVLSNLVISFKATANEKKLDLVLNLHDLEHIIAELDDLRMGQVISNLLSNAIKFTEKGYVSVKAYIPEGTSHLSVEVTDSGIGLTSEQTEVIFDAFKQADSSTSRKYGGTGLGLALSAAIIELMGGKLKVTSEPGKGSTFYFTVPIDIQQSTEQKPNLREQKWSGLKVMALDDIQPNLDVLSAILTDLDAYVDCFTDPLKALEQVKGGVTYDLVIIDYMMPELDGISWIQKAQLGAKTKRVLFTSIDDAQTIEKAKPHFEKIIHKPALERDIISLIDIEVDSPAPVSEESTLQLQGKVLVVEDNQINYMIIESLLINMGLDVTWAEDGEQALEFYAKDCFDVIFMDCMLPGIDGYQATESIRASSRPGSSSIPIIALTADTTGGNESKCYQAGMNDYLTKPFNIETVQSILGRYLSAK